jgi:hypothetical protein
VQTCCLKREVYVVIIRGNRGVTRRMTRIWFAVRNKNGRRGSLADYLGKRVLVGVHLHGKTVDSRLRVGKTGDLRHDKCLSQINKISRHTLKTSRVSTAVSCLDEVVVSSYNNISRFPCCRSTMPTSEFLMAVSSVTDDWYRRSVSR